MTELNYDILVDKLIEKSLATRTKAVGSTPNASYGHGPGGLFSHWALERPIFSAMMLPRDGLHSRLPSFPTNLTSPLYGIMTGVTATSGDEPIGVCDDPPTSGLMKLCMQTRYLGRQSRMTNVYDLDRIGMLRDRADHTDLQLYGNPFSDNPNVPTIPGMGGDRALNTEVGKALFELGASWSRDFAREFYTGNPANNTAGGGRKFFRGLDLLINTGYRDAESGVACPAADSIVESFGNVDVATGGATIVAKLTDIFRRLRIIASGTGLNPVKWVIVMRPGLFYQLTEVWPCAYATYRCQSNFTEAMPMMTDSGRMIEMRDQMRGNMDELTGQYLMIDGARVEVILDEAITETNAGNGHFRSSIYIVPMTVLGRVPVTYLEYVKYDMSDGAMDAANFFAPQGSFYPSDNGRFLWHKKPPTNFCVQVLAKTEPSLILRTPYIAARLTNVQYTPLMHERDPFLDSGYNLNGGRTGQDLPTYYTPTA